MLLENVRFHREETDNDPEFAKKAAEQFQKRMERARIKELEKEAKARRIAAKIAAKEAKKNKNDYETYKAYEQNLYNPSAFRIKHRRR